MNERRIEWSACKATKCGEFLLLSRKRQKFKKNPEQMICLDDAVRGRVKWFHVNVHFRLAKMAIQSYWTNITFAIVSYCTKQNGHREGEEEEWKNDNEETKQLQMLLYCYCTAAAAAATDECSKKLIQSDKLVKSELHIDRMHSKSRFCK